MNFAPLEPLESAPEFPVIAFPFRSQERAMIQMGKHTLIFENGDESKLELNDLPFNIYGRFDPGQGFVVDDIEMTGNANNRSNMLLELDSDFIRTVMVHVRDLEALDFLFKSSQANGDYGLVVRPFKSMFGDTEYEMTRQLS